MLTVLIVSITLAGAPHTHVGSVQRRFQPGGKREKEDAIQPVVTRLRFSRTPLSSRIVNWCSAVVILVFKAIFSLFPFLF